MNNIFDIEDLRDRLFYTIVGNYDEMNTLMEHVSKNNNRRYFISPLIRPVADIAFDHFIENGTDIQLQDKIEFIQCSLVSNFYDNDGYSLYLLLCIDNSILSLPQINSEKTTNIEHIIKKDFGKPFSKVNNFKVIQLKHPSNIMVYYAKL